MQNNIHITNQPKLVRILLDPLLKFIQMQVASGIILLGTLAIALIWVNSSFSESYFHFWHTPIGFKIAGFNLERDLHFWINDGLMAIFFFVVGLEIKREILTGELASPAKAALPIIAAIGGMVVPGIIYTAFNWGGEGQSGWGIPMATDIAFALGVLSLMGKRVPLALKVFLAALAIVDDMGAVVLIAVFYTSQISWIALAAAGLFYALLWMINLSGIRNLLPYVALGLFLWLALLKSGVHPTIAGVLAATTIPARPKIRRNDFVEINTEMLEVYKKSESIPDKNEAEEMRQEAVLAIESNCEKIQPPLIRLEHNLSGFVSFLIMPLFALANAGIAIDTSLISHLKDNVSMGIVFGLFAGKTIGIALFSIISIKMGLGALPGGASKLQMLGVAVLGGIGFTMSIFIANLAFTNNLNLLPEAKLAILLGSLISGIVGSVILNIAYSRKKADKHKLVS